MKQRMQIASEAAIGSRMIVRPRVIGAISKRHARQKTAMMRLMRRHVMAWGNTKLMPTHEADIAEYDHATCDAIAAAHVTSGYPEYGWRRYISRVWPPEYGFASSLAVLWISILCWRQSEVAPAAAAAESPTDSTTVGSEDEPSAIEAATAEAPIEREPLEPRPSNSMDSASDSKLSPYESPPPESASAMPLSLASLPSDATR